MERNKIQQIDKERDKTENHVSTGAAGSHHQSNAAQTVFNTPEILEHILKQLPMDFVGRALTVSKYCQNVILGSGDLRRTLFLEPAPASDYIQMMKRPISFVMTCFGSIVSHGLKEFRRITVQAHPFLTTLEPRPWLQASSPSSSDWTSLGDATHKILSATLDKTPVSALVFQPPPPEVRLFYIFDGVLEGGPGGVTFGAVRDELDGQRKECAKIVSELATCPLELMTSARQLRVQRALEFCRNIDSKQYRLDDMCVLLNVEHETEDKVQYRSRK